ncbi:thioredoxin domain-containing protein [Acidisphaera sp. S103]|uniref:thioredoxin domain-containing protein n=1 Tax=Acidisphaera sp. S103 TaxID=1747223 RepID=UPI00131C5165|nr:thioredoxin domain-containing protein [Acidisphaera sp. S103]
MAAPENLLGQETSPYLLQHAGNPVHWRPWGKAALDEAREANKPIMVSIGYAACHWCHVMAHESFEDPKTAALMNSLFVNIKIDREERPDIDHIYMSALHALGEQGGWPLTMFTTPDGSPFWGGTYFPPEPRWGRPSFRQVLQGVANAFHTGAEAVTQNTKALKQYLDRQAVASVGDAPGPAHLDAVAQAYLRMTDPEHGGLRGAPKFPNPPIYRFLWQNGFRTGQGEAWDALHLMLRRMSQGGIYDHLGGGYARYSTDDIWLVPHFEKMLYDNAQLLELLALAHADRPDPLYAERAAETVGWMMRDMTAQRIDGKAAFAASEDADSEGEEGRFYVWTEAEVDSLLGAGSEAFKRAYDVTPGGNWEGHTILRRVTPRGARDEEDGLARARDVLFRAREKRVRPGWDDKVLADWNGLAIAALARAAGVFGRPGWLERAREAFDFVVTHMGASHGGVEHAWRLGRVTAPGLIEDQAAMARAALALFEATGEAAYLTAAERLANAAQDAFADGHGGFYATAAGASDVPMTRPRTAADNATPAGNGMMAEVLGRLFHLTGGADWRARADGVLTAFAGEPDQLSGMPTLLAAADLLEEAATVVLTGSSDALLAAALGAPDPAVVVLRVSGTDALPADHPAFGKVAGPGGAVAYVCRRNVCGLPIADPLALSQALRTRV